VSEAIARILARRFKVIPGARVAIGITQNIGHLLFLSAGLAWACSTVAMRRAWLHSLYAAALAAATSLALYLPIYLRVFDWNQRLQGAPVRYHLSSDRAEIFDWDCRAAPLRRMVSILGATKGAAFLALTPAMTSSHGHSDPQRVAFGSRLHSDRPDLGQRARS
jgi:hypothetical protein